MSDIKDRDNFVRFGISSNGQIRFSDQSERIGDKQFLLSKIRIELKSGDNQDFFINIDLHTSLDEIDKMIENLKSVRDSVSKKMFE